MKELDWKILITLYEKRSMSKAAESLFITQSALSKRLKSMEEEWHVELVKRTNQGVIFTDNGHYLVKRAHIMIDFLKEIEEHFSENYDAKELLTIGVPNSFARLHMPALFKEYKARYDEVQIKTISNSSDVIIQQLTDGTIDLGIICGDYPFYGEKVCLFKEKLYVLTPKGLSFDEIGHQPLIRSYLNPMVKLLVDQWWKDRFGNRPHETHNVPYSEIAIEMVENGLGISFMFGDKWRYNKDLVELVEVYGQDGQPITRNVWMMANSRCFRSQAIMDFISLVEEIYQVN